ncbi:hypothetical protein M8J76_014745 [Diaphorina citri]|nr:hypothetical protein M8J76_014745 [Diaphorina citri]
MSLVLRSSQFVRSLVSVSRKITLTSRSQISSTLLPSSVCTSQISSFTLSRSFATQPNVAPLANDSTVPINVSIRKLDDEARRVGRVSASEIKNVLSSLNRSNPATSTQALMLIRCCGNLLPEEIPENRTQLVHNLWQSFEKLNVPLDISHYNALLRVYLDNEHTFSPTDFLAKLESQGIEPNRVTYQQLISKYCQDGNIEGATKILEFMRDKTFPISEGVFNALIYGHSQANDMASAEGILTMMSQAGLEPSAQTYTKLMCGYAKHGDMDSVRRLLAQSGSSLVNGDYLDIIHALAVSGHGEYIDEIISKIQPGVGYSADAANHIYHLINKGQIDAAYRIVNTLARSANINGEQLPVGGFLVRHMVKTNQPIDKVLAVCQRLTDENLHPRAFNLAVQVALEYSPLDTLVVLLREFKTRGGAVRPHYFWPALVREGRANNTAEVLRILQVAEAEFGVGSNTETLRDYVLPVLSPPNQVSGEVFSQLRSVGVTIGSITSAYVVHMLRQHNLKEAALLAKSFRAHYAKVVVRPVLTVSYLRTQDLPSLVTVVRAVCENWEKGEEGEKEEEGEEKTAGQLIDMDRIFAGNVLLDIYKATRQDPNVVSHLEQLLNAFVEHGIPISAFSSDYIQNGLGSALTSDISKALGALTSDDLTPQPLQYVPSMFIPRGQPLNPEKLKELITKLESKGENASGQKRSLLVYYIKQKDLDNALEYYKVLEADPQFTPSPGLLSLLINLSAELENLEVASQYYAEFTQKFPDAKIDGNKVFRLAYVLLKNGKESEMMDLLRKNAPSAEDREEESSPNAPAWRLLNLCAETTNPETTKRLFELLRTSNYIQPNNVLLGSLIKAHVLKEDYTGAVETFEYCVNQFRATPWKGELLKRFIQAEDAACLQRITDLSTSIHGEVNSLYDLMLSFLDAGRLRQARKILETPGMKLRPERLNQIIDYYVSSGSTDKIENLLKVTQGLDTFNRSVIYWSLLNLYSASDDVDKALALWTQMQEDDETPSDQFLIQLSALLTKNGREVPFATPKAVPEQGGKRVRAVEAVSTPDSRLRSLVRSGKVREALKVYQTNKSELNIISHLELISGLLTQGHKSEATQVMNELTREDLETLRSGRPLRNIMDHFSTAELKSLKPKLSEDMLGKSMFTTILIKAHLKEGTIKEYLADLKADVSTADGNEEKLKALIRRLPMGGILATLDTKPDLLPEVTDLANQLAASGFTPPVEALFNYYYINGLHDEAEQILEKHLLSKKRFKYRPILRHCSKTEDLAPGERLLTLVKNTSDLKSLSNVYTELISLAIQLGRVDSALDLLTRAVDDSATELIQRPLVDKLQTLASKHGKTVPLAVINRIAFGQGEKKKNESTSSSSDSDEEVSRKQEGK